jgi:hypothetical protein
MPGVIKVGLAIVFVMAALAGWLVTEAARDAPAYDGPRDERPVAGSTRIEGSAPDPFGVPQWAVATEPERMPAWALLVWRTRSGATCFEPGQVVDRNTPGRSDQLPGIRSTGPKTLGRLVGSLRPDARSGTGIQFYGLGRFTPLRPGEGGSCGDPSGGAGLLVARETYTTRRDLGPARTIVAGLAGPRVASVAVGGRALPLRGPDRAFVVVRRGAAAPAVVVTYRDGSRRSFSTR